MLAMFGGSMVSGLAGPLLGLIPNDPNSSVTNPYADMSSTGGNSLLGPMGGLFGGLFGGGGSSSGGGSTPATGGTTGSTGSSGGFNMKDTNTQILVFGGAALVLILLIK